MVNTEEPKADTASNAQTVARNSVMRRLARRGWSAVAALGMLLGLSVFNASPASAYVGENTLRNWETGMCLTLQNGYIHTSGCELQNPLQIWQPIFIQHLAYDIVVLKNKGTGTCLSLEADGYLGHPSCSMTSDRHQWEARGTGWDKIMLRNWSGPYCIGSGYTGAIFWTTCSGDGGLWQWKLGY